MKSLALLAVAACIAGCVGHPPVATSSPLAKGAATPHAQLSAPPTPVPTGAVTSLSAVQLLNANTGYIAAWGGAGPPLARTADGGLTWRPLPVPVSHLTALRFIDSNVGWVAGLIPRSMQGVACQQAPPDTSVAPCYGAVLRTEDGGTTWQKSLLIPYNGTYGEPVVGIQAIDGEIAWALVLDCTPTTVLQRPLGCPAHVRHTIDGGRSWTTPVSGYIVAIRFATAMRGWLALINPDGSSDIDVTSDGGATWTSHLRTTSGTVVGLDAANSLTAWVMTQDGAYCSASICDRYELLRTTDGGITWSGLGNPKATAAGCSGGHLVGPLFASPSRGWLAENQGAGGARVVTGLLSTEDGGRTWRCVQRPANTYLVSAADPLHIWITTNRLGDDATSLFSSEDGGASWREVSIPTPG